MYEKQRYILTKGMPNSIYVMLRNAKAIVAGGAVRAVFAGEKISDYDVFVDSQQTVDALREGFCGDGCELFISPSAMTYSSPGETTIQVVTLPELVGLNASQIIQTFDYSVCTGAYDFASEEFVLGDIFLEDVARRTMRYNIACGYPLCAMFRIRKYLEKGYKISGTEIVKVGLAINALRMETFADLRKQLMGIDTLFLRELTDKLLSSEYAEKEYDFNEFMTMLDGYMDDVLDEAIE